MGSPRQQCCGTTVWFCSTLLENGAISKAMSVPKRLLLGPTRTCTWDVNCEFGATSKRVNSPAHRVVICVSS